MIREITDEDVAVGKADLFTLTTQNEIEVEKSGITTVIRGIERYYTPPELVRMVNRIGLKIDHVYSGTAGNWNKETIKLDEIEFMAIGHKKDHKGRSKKL